MLRERMGFLVVARTFGGGIDQDATKETARSARCPFLSPGSGTELDDG